MVGRSTQIALHFQFKCGHMPELIEVVLEDLRFALVHKKVAFFNEVLNAGKDWGAVSDALFDKAGFHYLMLEFYISLISALSQCVKVGEEVFFLDLYEGDHASPNRSMVLNLDTKQWSKVSKTTGGHDTSFVIEHAVAGVNNCLFLFCHDRRFVNRNNEMLPKLSVDVVEKQVWTYASPMPRGMMAGGFGPSRFRPRTSVDIFTNPGKQKLFVLGQRCSSLVLEFLLSS